MRRGDVCTNHVYALIVSLGQSCPRAYRVYVYAKRESMAYLPPWLTSRQITRMNAANCWPEIPFPTLSSAALRFFCTQQRTLSHADHYSERRGVPAPPPRGPTRPCSTACEPANPRRPHCHLLLPHPPCQPLCHSLGSRQLRPPRGLLPRLRHPLRSNPQRRAVPRVCRVRSLGT